ncbi:hypothetical protein [Shewanella dokdonensis]|uniref:FAD/FMN-containing dehydrogenase n=1 Tax=Shewanella dokdonensis TaxID=712036 RepID=A0ABX8DHZ8_9GAMM|nr:hypothetical protein [Shewanella dokdonensis]MCL1076265.1 hypothetical protein [Shewanella dokdonensis]QVK24300.1 hypothetical protein KHX94_07175 [Shewanella dokdonensis]
MKIPATLLMIGLALFTARPALASEYAVGDVLRPLELQNQFETKQTLDSNNKLLIFTRSMAGSKIARTALDGVNAEAMQGIGLIYIADISGMPSLIARLVAIPKMKDFSFPVALDREGQPTKLFPVAEDTAALINLQQLKITQIRYFDDADSLKQALQNSGLSLPASK